LVSMRQRVRVYTPYGQLLPGMAYLVRRLLENTANESFLRASFTENVPEEQLLMNPATKRMNDEGGRMLETSEFADDSSFHEEPITDFSRPAARDEMSRALRDVASQLGRSYPLVIDGKAITSAQTIDSVNPCRTTQIVGKCGR